MEHLKLSFAEEVHRFLAKIDTDRLRPTLDGAVQNSYVVRA